MQRLVQTSLGPVVLYFYEDAVWLTLLDENGWAVKEGECGDNELARGLVHVLGLGEHEANEIEEKVLAEYRERGGVPSGEGERRSGPTEIAFVALFLAIAATFLVGLMTIASGLWELVT